MSDTTPLPDTTVLDDDSNPTAEIDIPAWMPEFWLGPDGQQDLTNPDYVQAVMMPPTDDDVQQPNPRDRG